MLENLDMLIKQKEVEVENHERNAKKIELEKVRVEEQIKLLQTQHKECVSSLKELNVNPSDLEEELRKMYAEIEETTNHINELMPAEFSNSSNENESSQSMPF